MISQSVHGRLLTRLVPSQEICVHISWWLREHNSCPSARPLAMQNPQESRTMIVENCRFYSRGKSSTLPATEGDMFSTHRRLGLSTMLDGWCDYPAGRCRIRLSRIRLTPPNQGRFFFSIDRHFALRIGLDLFMWIQKQLRLPAAARGFHLITRQILAEVPELSRVRIGMMQVFIQHTSASLTINENADPDVRIDFETAMNHAVPESLPYVHTLEGPDDMPAHVKASMMGSSVMIPIGDGRLQLGTWQGIYLCEHRDRGGARSVIVTISGEENS